MIKRLRADTYFTAQRDFYCLTNHIGKISVANPHCHEFYEVEIVTAGTCIDTIDGVSYSLNRGDFAFIHPDNCHYLYSEHDKGAVIFNLAISISLMEEILAFLDLENTSLTAWPMFGQLPQELLFQLAEQTRQLIIPTKHTIEDRSLVKQWLITCFLCCPCLHKSEKEKKLPGWMEQLLSELKTPEGLYGGVSYLKTHTQLSYSHVCRYFQKYLHQTPVEWINEQRLLYSANLLLNTNMSILEVSLECGFRNLSHFNHLFKAFMGISPSALRMLF